MGENCVSRILFMGVGFHKYDQAIISELQKYHVVDYINLDCFHSLHPIEYRVYYRLGLNYRIKKNNEKQIYEDLNSLNSRVYDTLFVIKGANLTKEHLSFIDCKFTFKNKILYLWDGYANHSNIELLRRYFKEIYSFDYLDCERYCFIKRPLFYIPSQGPNSSIRNIDMSFVGQNHSDRKYWLSKFVEYCKINHLSFFFFLSTGWFQILVGIISGRIRFNDLKFMKTGVLSYSKYKKVTSSSKAIIDFPNNHQTGLTMRTIEALGMGTKVITTNSYIKSHTDIPEIMYYVVDTPQDINEGVISFISSSKVAILPERYTINGFLKELNLI